ncbi:hypothetical protein Daus18300_009871 [Diaporthe australafricana]|uniref:Xylanolytic transcriptional activator regulatory domain-containing protein n=1 Tax=Diaporthe australafricana TaxID=127596 RepID=A0ABR3WCI5_9PEZI
MQAPDYDAEGPSAINHSDFPVSALPFNDFFDVDWVWNHSMMSYVDGEIDVDGLQLQGTNDLSPPQADPQPSLSDPSPTLLNDEDSTDDEDHSVVTNQLSHRLGSLLMTDSGERHFYGATSNFNLARGGNVAVMCANRSEKGRQANARFEAAGIDQDIGRDLEDHLLQLFFTWHNSSLYVVDQAIFTKAREELEQGKCDSSFYSPFLLNSMCAVGAAFETRKHPDLPAPLAEFFANRAITLLDLELQHPRISTVQALSILSSHEAASTQDTQGWLFSGMAVRLAIDFGLHISSKPYVEAGSMSVEEARGRSVAFWGAFATDHMWGLYLGRPLHNISQAITVETPVAFSGDENQWRAECVTGGTKSPGEHKLDHQELFVEQWVQLPRIMSPLEGSLYFQTDVNKVDLVRLAQRTLEYLLSWRKNLPQELEVDLDSPAPPKCAPHVLVLHMLYEYLIILLHRPFVAKRYIQPYPLIGRGPQHAREMCVRSASRISILLSWYEKQHSFSQINILVVQITFSAALILVYATVSERDIQNHRLLTGHLEMCCRALAELGNVFTNATRTLDVLLHVKRTWQARLVAASAGSKRRAAGSSAGTPTKRRTTSDVART